MKLVLDTNVLVSTIFWDGPEWRVLEACIAGEHRLILSPAILDELRRAGVLPQEYVERVVAAIEYEDGRTFTPADRERLGLAGR